MTDSCSSIILYSPKSTVDQDTVSTPNSEAPTIVARSTFIFPSSSGKKDKTSAQEGDLDPKSPEHDKGSFCTLIRYSSCDGTWRQKPSHLFSCLPEVLSGVQVPRELYSIGGKRPGIFETIQQFAKSTSQCKSILHTPFCPHRNGFPGRISGAEGKRQRWPPRRRGGRCCLSKAFK